jgi:hypothetical protein
MATLLLILAITTVRLYITNYAINNLKVLHITISIKVCPSDYHNVSLITLF